MWSRVVSRNVVMTDSSEKQVAALSGTEESNASLSASRAVVGPAVESTGTTNNPPVHSTATLVTAPNSRKSSVSSARSIEPVHQSSTESGSPLGERTPGEGAASTSESTTDTDRVPSHNVVANEPTEVITSRPAATSHYQAPPSTSTGTTNPAATSNRLTHPSTTSTSTSAGTNATTEPTTMNGNSDYHSTSRSSASNSSSSSSSRRQRNGLFGINLDLNFDPSSWLVPSNVAGRSISSLSVLPDWVRHPVSIIPNRTSENNPTSQSNSGLSDGRRSQQHHDPASRVGSHHHHHHTSQGGGGGGGAGASWNSSSFQTSNSIPSNMQHHHHSHHSSVPLRTRHTVVNSMRSVDEDLDADYNPVSTIDIGATGRDHRDDTHSYVIDMDSPMGGWAEEDGPSSSTQGLRGAGSSSGVGLTSSSASSDGNATASTGDIGGGSRRSISDINLSPERVIPGIPGAPGGGGDGSQPSMTDAATGASERTRAAEILRDAPETRAFINEISRYTTIRPFIVINFLKGVFDHGTSILAFLALVVTFSHANSMVKKEVSKQRKRNLLYLTMIVVNLMACVAFIYYIFNEMELYYALVFLPTQSDLSAFWSLMWAVGVTDYVAKFGTVLVKIVVVSLPGCILPFQKRGKFYLFIEYSSQLYRSFLPVYPWLFYLVSAYEGTARMFGLLLAGIYVIFKITDSVKRFKDWLKALEKLLSNVHYGTNPTPKQLDGAGTICPICHDNFANPTRLQCSHIFCEECVATWFDRERTCPMCRAKVVDDPTYRDGSTSQYIQLF